MLFTLIYLFSTVTQAQTQDQRRISGEIKQLSNQVTQQQQQFNKLNNEVTTLEKRLGDITRQQRETEQKRNALQTRLGEASRDRARLGLEVDAQRLALAQQLQAMFTTGNQSHLRLLLRQDNPADISRTLRYFEYLNKHRSDRINDINKSLVKIQNLTANIEKDQADLKIIEATLAEQRQTIQTTLSAREKVLAQANSTLRNQQARLDKLRREEAALEAKLKRIADEQARKRAAEARQAEQARQPAARAAQPAAAPATNQAQTSTGGRALQTGSTPRGSFASLRGKLASPVNGRIIHGYGSRRNEKQKWRGIVIEAPGGSNVQAVADGRVVFAGWWDGYGHLMIIEHDANYMSLYGYNRALYKREGQTVKANEVIAAVGNSSGRSQNALYFEIRYRNATQNPAQWLR